MWCNLDSTAACGAVSCGFKSRHARPLPRWGSEFDSLRAHFEINLKVISFQIRELTLKTEKARILDILLIPAPLFKQTMEFIKANMTHIEQAKGYIFFKDCVSANSAVYLGC